MKLRTTEICQVPFYTGRFEIIDRSKGPTMVPLRSSCAAIGIAYRPQLARLKRCVWSGITSIDVSEKRGRVMPIAAIPLDSFCTWLATIRPSRVAFEVRRKLELYQLEIRGVIEGYVLGRRAYEATFKTLRAEIKRRRDNATVA
jgi:hypothetical protein